MAPAVLALAPHGATWLVRLVALADAGRVSAEVVVARSCEEARARLASTRPFALLVADDAVPGLDRDLLDAATRTGTPALVVASPDRHALWVLAGAMRGATAESVVDDVDAQLAGAHAGGGGGDPARLAPLVGVCGPGGTGASTIAAALAQGLGADHRTVLVDMVRHAEQAMLHDIAEPRGGVQALVELHRTGAPGPDAVAALAHAMPGRGYDLVPGLRRPRAWSLLRPRAVEAALTTLRTAYEMVVADIDADFEGEAEGGSLDVEERNTMSRAVAVAARCVVVVAAPGLKGTHAGARVASELWALGVDPARVLVVVNRADEVSVAVMHAALRRTYEAAGAPAAEPVVVAAPSAPVDECLVDGRPLPPSVVDVVTPAVMERVRDVDAPDATFAPTPVAPGELANFSDES